MHEMIKMSIAHLLEALSSHVFTDVSSSMAFQKVPCPAILEQPFCKTGAQVGSSVAR